MKTPHALVLTLLICASITACTIAREDVLECGLPDGGKFILVAKYDWDPIAKILPADVSVRLNQGQFEVYFKPKWFLRKAKVELLSVNHESIEELETSKNVCQRFGVKNGVPYAGTRYFLPPKSKTFVAVEFDRKLVLSMYPPEDPNNIRFELEKLNAYPSAGAISPVNGRLVSERSLTDPNELVIAVFKSESHDNGKTWRDPIITAQAEIFEIGKPVGKQSFIARPARINGRIVRANFPSPAHK